MDLSLVHSMLYLIIKEEYLFIVNDAVNKYGNDKGKLIATIILSLTGTEGVLVNWNTSPIYGHFDTSESFNQILSEKINMITNVEI